LNNIYAFADFERVMEGDVEGTTPVTDSAYGILPLYSLRFEWEFAFDFSWACDAGVGYSSEGPPRWP
jgi:hypothetical protein